MSYIYGTDPEIFSTYTKDGKKFALPPYFFRKYLGVEASSDPKHPVFIEGSGWKLHEDGAAWEMSISPSANPKELFDTIQDCKMAGESIIKGFEEYCNPTLEFLPTVGFEVERWKDEGRDFHMATRFGCDPDNDAYSTDDVCRTEDASAHPYRYAGGHIHVSGSKLLAEEPILSIKCLSMTAGLSAIHYSDMPELDKLRTYLYGKPGKYRIQHYGRNNKFGPEYATGIEYRSPSARWASSWNIAEKVFQWLKIGLSELLEGGLGLELLGELEIPTANAIIQADQKSAGQILSYIESRI